MKETIKTLVLVLALFVSKQTQIFAQGTAFTYQGRLNSGGGAATGSYDFRFKLFADVLGNTQVGSSYVTNAIGVTNGLFLTTIDFGAGIFTGASFWLEVDVKTNSGASYAVLTPLQSVLPTPYAITAANVSGPVPAAQIAGGTIGTVVALTNAANQLAGSFTGNGANVVNVNAAALNGLTAMNFWQLGGNNVAGGQFLGSTNNQPVEIWANGARAWRLEPASIGKGAPNVIGGGLYNSVAPGVSGAVVAGGGTTNYNGYGWIYSNSVAGDFGTVGGGYDNHIQTGATSSTIGGGQDNQIEENISTIAGGYQNHIVTWGSMIGGGYGNLIDSNSSWSMIGCGYQNYIRTNSAYSVIGGGYNNQVGNSLGLNNWLIYPGDGNTIGGGVGNFTGAETIGSCIAGGKANTIQTNASFATIPGGLFNQAAGLCSFAAGRQAQALNDGAFVWADSQGAVFSSTGPNQFLIRAAGGVGVGVNNPSYTADFGGRIRLRGTVGTSTGGLWIYDTVRAADRAFIGQAADGLVGLWGNSGANWALVVNVTNSYVGIGNNNANPAHQLQVGNAYCDGNQWYPVSDRNVKSGFETISARTVLDKVAALPITRWHYTNDLTTAHLGPMAQDFYAAFQVGPDDRHISTLDEGSVALAAIQGLNEKLEACSQELAARNQKLEAENAELKQNLTELKQLVQALASKPSK